MPMSYQAMKILAGSSGLIIQRLTCCPVAHLAHQLVAGLLLVFRSCLIITLFRCVVSLEQMLLIY